MSPRAPSLSHPVSRWSLRPRRPRAWPVTVLSLSLGSVLCPHGTVCGPHVVPGLHVCLPRGLPAPPCKLTLTLRLHRARRSRGLFPATATVVAALAGPRHRYCPKLACSPTPRSHRAPAAFPLAVASFGGGGAASTHHADLPRGHSDLTPSRFFCCVLSLGLRVRTFAGGARLSWPCPRRVPLVLSGLLPLLQPVSSACAAVPQPAAPHLPPLWPSFGGGWLAGLGLGGHGLRREPKLGAEPGCHWAHPRGRRWI